MPMIVCIIFINITKKFYSLSSLKINLINLKIKFKITPNPRKIDKKIPIPFKVEINFVVNVKFPFVKYAFKLSTIKILIHKNSNIQIQIIFWLSLCFFHHFQIWNLEIDQKEILLS